MGRIHGRAASGDSSADSAQGRDSQDVLATKAHPDRNNIARIANVAEPLIDPIAKNPQQGPP